MGSYMAKESEVKRKWYVVDAKDKILGRLATRVASVLRGKHKAIFTPHVDTGDFVIVINAGKVKLSGKKESLKTYISHSGYPGGFKAEKFNHLKERYPEKIIELAVKGMLPKGKLGRQIAKKLKIYKGSEHPHKTQKPEVLN